MVNRRIDGKAMVRLFAVLSTRRWYLAAFVAIGLGCLAPLLHDETGYSRKKRRKKRRNKRRRKLVTRADAACPPTAPIGRANSRRFAQTFLALHSGQLTRASVELTLNVADDTERADFDLEIREVDEAGAPASTILAAATVTNVPAFVSGPPRVIAGTFRSPATVVAGTRYALTVSKQSAFNYGVNTNQANPCPDGTLFLDAIGDETFIPVPDADLVFATFVTIRAKARRNEEE